MTAGFSRADVRVPTMPTAISAALNHLGTEEPDLRHLAGILGGDPGLTARILTLANSSALGAGGATSDLAHAVGRIGLASLKQVLLDLVVTSMVPAKDKSLPWKTFWRHCSVTGQIALRLGTVLRPMAAPHLHIAGLLHDVGLFVMAWQAPQMVEALGRCCMEEGLTLAEAERRLLMPSHGSIGALAAMSWNFPPIVSVLIHHHETRGPRDGMSREEEDLVNIIALARALALRFDVVPPGARAAPVSPTLFGVPDLPRETVLNAVEAAKRSVDALCNT